MGHIPINPPVEFTQIAPNNRPLCRILRPIISVFLRVFDIFQYISALFDRVLFRLFGSIIRVILIFVFLGKRGNIQVLAQIATYYQPFFRLFWPIISFFFLLHLKKKKTGENSQNHTLIG